MPASYQYNKKPRKCFSITKAKLITLATQHGMPRSLATKANKSELCKFLGLEMNDYTYLERKLFIRDENRF